MGYNLVSGRFSATLSNHNSPKDVRHEALWLDFLDKIKGISNNPKYKEINLEISADTDDF